MVAYGCLLGTGDDVGCRTHRSLLHHVLEYDVQPCVGAAVLCENCTQKSNLTKDEAIRRNGTKRNAISFGPTFGPSGMSCTRWFEEAPVLRS